MSSPTVLDRLTDELEVFFQPLVLATKDTPAGREELVSIFQAIGVEVTESQIGTVQSSLSPLEGAIEALDDSVGGGESDSLGAVATALGSARDVFETIEQIEDDSAFVDAEDVVPHLVEYLTVVYVQRQRPSGFFVATLLGVFSVSQPDLPDEDAIPRYPHPYDAGGDGDVELNLEQIGSLLEDPVEALREEYVTGADLSENEFDSITVYGIEWLAAVANWMGLYVSVGAEPTDLDEADDGVDARCSPTLLVSVPISEDTTLRVQIAFTLTEDGIALLLSTSGEAGTDVPFGNWVVQVDLGGSTPPSLLTPDGIEPLDADDEPALSATVGLEKQSTDGTESALVVGANEGTRFEVGQLGIESATTATATAVESDTTAYARDSSLVVAPGDGDSFIKHVLPEDGVGIDFDAGLGWSTERGLYFQGGGSGLDTDLPVGLNVADVLTVDTLHLAAKPDTSGETVTVPVQVAANPQVSLGPIDATVEGIGLEAEIAFPEGNDGNLGPLDVDLGFKPPDGAGLSVDASAVVGGGYLEFDHENERYAGVLQLQVGELTLSAVGLLTTQLPGGRDGFSLLLIISGEFPPVQLGFGFTLNGVGGLLGINRTMDVDYLVAGVSDGTVSSIMFPDDPVRNAPQIISDLRNGFPVAAGNHVFGPMGKLAWGTPTMLSASLGVLLELPDPIRVAILGRVHAGLPHEEVGIVVFNMDVIGAIDIGEQQASAAASLYDSRILAYTLTGDMAMKTGWGGDPEFVLSVGGFNPRYDPPEDFPELRRIALTLGPGNPRIRWEGYFAVTANTVQVGASVEVYAAAGGFSFEGDMGFDTLFRFDPFELIADFYAGFALMRGGSTIMAVDVDGTLAGPGPWHVTGDATFEIWPIEFEISVDEEFGESESADGLPPADVFGKVVDALGDERNWSAQRPEDGDSVVTLRQVESREGEVLAHPLGQCSVRQTVAPLGITIEEYEGSSPAEYDRFEIVDASVGDADEDPSEATREQFARGEYFDLSDDEKLEGPEFERYEAGTHLSNTGFGWGGEDDEDLLGGDVLEYETAVIDDQADGFDPIHLDPVGMPQSTAACLASVSAVARGALRTTGEERFAVDETETGPTGVDASVTVGDPNYVVARTDDLTRVDLDLPEAGTTKREAEEALSGYLDSNGGDPDDYQICGVHETLSVGVNA
ncbi:DUF6603 domain-containing protein [Natrarchaeobius chitinivorans]|uniref:DUF6603 domain-containing protein n=1 Tax=Natrarchaeobius chitinivorans TaxID=1679083 RepID=A0A3N6PBZ2_NATCH|nr:DUF6603 domain-containing protein [Natrarchaeobius chitinivorans]RQG94175.1 hypothetical protein EA473_12420 [Natrarchaeobius chitinivorans]